MTWAFVPYRGSPGLSYFFEDCTNDMKLILASSSPRRRQLLVDAGYSFSVDLPDDSAESAETGDVTPKELVALLAFRKAENVALRTGEAMILAADTVAECAGQVLGKPRDVAHAREMLMTMSGQSHYVHTGICLWSRPDDQHIVRTCTTELIMKTWEATQLENYLAGGEWQGKAGAFGFQDGLDWVRIVSGSESNVVGLPMELLEELLLEASPGSYRFK